MLVVKGENEELMMARVILVDCTRIVIKNILELIRYRRLKEWMILLTEDNSMSLYGQWREMLENQGTSVENQSFLSGEGNTGL